MWILIAGTWIIFRANGVKDLFYIGKSVLFDISFKDFFKQLVLIEQEIWFQSVTFGIWMIGTLFINIVILLWLDYRYNFYMEKGQMLEHVFCQVEDWKRTAVYIWMLFSIVIWYIIQSGEYIAKTDFIYFQF